MLGEFDDNSCWLLISLAQLTQTLIQVLLMEQIDIAGGKDDKLFDHKMHSEIHHQLESYYKYYYH